MHRRPLVLLASPLRSGFLVAPMWLRLGLLVHSAGAPQNREETSVVSHPATSALTPSSSSSGGWRGTQRPSAGGGGGGVPRKRLAARLWQVWLWDLHRLGGGDGRTRRCYRCDSLSSNGSSPPRTNSGDMSLYPPHPEERSHRSEP
ncbi:unnamed protein product [Boreogadus saida]